MHKPPLATLAVEEIGDQLWLQFVSCQRSLALPRHDARHATLTKVHHRWLLGVIGETPGIYLDRVLVGAEISQRVVSRLRVTGVAKSGNDLLKRNTVADENGTGSRQDLRGVVQRTTAQVDLDEPDGFPVVVARNGNNGQAGDQDQRQHHPC